MIDFSFSEEQEMLRRSIRSFAAKEIAPITAEYDEKEEFPLFIFKRLADQGFLGIRAPQEYGGSGASAVSGIIFCEELGYFFSGITIGIYVQIFLVLNSFKFFGNDRQKQEYLVPGIQGNKIGAWGFAEPNAGSDPGAMTTRAIKKGDGYLINGTKMFITNGTFANFIIVTAKTDPEKGTKGMGLLIVDKGTPGFSVSRKLKKMCAGAAETTELVFEDCWVPREKLLGEENLGFYNAQKTLTEGRIVMGGLSVGMARAAFDLALKHAKERVQFGQPIGKFQGIQWMLAEMALDIEAAKLLTYQAAWLLDNGKTHLKEASMAKLFATEMCTRVANQAVQIHGGYGLMKEYEVHRFYRDCKIAEIGEGTSQIHKNIIAWQLGL